MNRRWICLMLACVLVFGMLPGLSLKVSAAMTVSDDFFTLLEAYEGFYAQPYEDYSQWSIGYGSYLAPNDGSQATLDLVAYYTANPITKEQAREWMRTELVTYTNPVNTFITNHGLTLKQHQFDALISFSYNCGAGWTSEEDGNFHRAVESGDLGDFLTYGMGLWSSAGSPPDYILISRRLSEINLYVNGVYSAYSYPANYRWVFLEGAGGVSRYRIHCYDANDNPEANGQKNGIFAEFKSAPVGPDENGAIVTYVFDGWYTARIGGTKVETLDGSLDNGTVLYAHWKTPSGTPVEIPEEKTGVSLRITVTTNALKVRTGPGTYYAEIGQVNTGDELIITLTGTSRGKIWGKFEGGWVCLDDGYTNYYSVIASALPRWGMVTADGVNVRSGAGTGYSVVTQKNKGDQINVTRWTANGDLMWGRIDEGWICLQYVQWNPGDYGAKIASVALKSAPTKTQYVQKSENLDLTGGVLEVTYEDQMVLEVPLSQVEVTGFDNSSLGAQTLTATVGTFTVSFDVEIIKATVTFQNFDGSVISSEQYEHGEAVAAPGEMPARPSDGLGYYMFIGWNKTVSDTCNGSVTYTAEYLLVGDINGNDTINEDDAIYLLRHILFPDIYGVETYADINTDGKLDEDDAIYLLRHILFSDLYPMAPAASE